MNMEDEVNVDVGSEGETFEVIQGGALTLPQDFSDSTLLTEGTLNGQQVIILTSSEDGKITRIQAVPPEMLGDETDDLSEPSPKRIRVEQDDGQTYVLAVAGNEGDDLQSDVLTSDLNPADLDSHDGLPGDMGPNAENTDVSQAWFTTKDDKTALQNKGHSWKQGQWSREEADLLKANIESYCRNHGVIDPKELIFEMSKDERKDFYRTIARGLQRPLFSVYRRVIRMYDERNHIGKYTPEELMKLSELRRKHGSDWATIGAALGRSASSVKDRCRLMKDTCNSGKWLPEEERRLAAGVYELSGCKPTDNVTSGLSWAMVAERVGTRSEKQCRTKWLNYLNWKQKGGAEWTREDDITLVLKIMSTGVVDETALDWTELAKGWPSVRSPQWLRGKWWSLKRHVPDYHLLSFTEILEQLRNMHSQNYRMKPLVTNNLRVRGVNLGRVGVLPNMTFTVPVSVPDGGDVAAVTVGEEEVQAAPSYQAYEVLHSIGSASAHQGAFLITQPQNNPAISFHAANMSTDHIIVHTLPINQVNENVTVQMNPTSQVIISTGEDGVESLEAGSVATLQLTSADQELQQLTDDDHIDASEGITAGDIDGEVHPGDLDPSVTVTADLVLASSASPQFVQSSNSESDLIHMSSLSDPMLATDNVDLIGCSSDVEVDKTQGHDVEGDVGETEVSSPDS